MYSTDMIIARHPVHLAVLLALVCLISGCGQDKVVTNKPETPVKIGFCSAPGISEQTDISIAIIELTVSTSTDIMQRELYVDQEKYVETDLPLPVGESLNFSAKAYESTELLSLDYPLCRGAFPENGGSVMIDPVVNAPITIMLKPIPITIGIRSKQDRVKPGDTYALEIYVENAYKLVALTCELRFDGNLLDLVDVRQGGLFGENEGEDFLFLYKEDPETSGGEQYNARIALALTAIRKPDTDGFYGPGIAFGIEFGTKKSGNTALDIPVSGVDVWKLEGDAFTRLEDPKQLIVEGKAAVEIIE